MTAIQLNFINNSNDPSYYTIAVFQKNVALQSQLPVAWEVITGCGQGDDHDFVFPLTMSVGANDSFGNYTPSMQAQNGQQFSAVVSPSGFTLAQSGAASDMASVDVVNAMPAGAIGASIYKGGKLLAFTTGIAPAQKTTFCFKPTIWIGIVPNAQQGVPMNSAEVADVNTELSLLGIASADIVMTGGGTGTGATPLTFVLENVVMA